MGKLTLRFDWLSGHPDRLKYKPLDKAEEISLIKAWQEKGDLRARDRIIMAFIPLAIPFARKASAQKGGMQNRDELMSDFMHEAVLGLIKAADRFMPDKGFRFATYARWWVVAAINEHLTRTHSIVPFITSSHHKRLFFRLRHEIRQAEQQLRLAGAYTGPGDALDVVAERMSLPKDFLEAFAGRLSGDHSLNAPSNSEEGADEYINLLQSDAPDAEEIMIDEDMSLRAAELIGEALGALTDREKEVIRRRHLVDREARHTLAAIGRDFGVTTERVRQIEVRAIEKMEKKLAKHREAFC